MGTSQVIDNLRMLNRKERFLFIGMALGNPRFELHRQFRDGVGKEFGLEVPDDAFVAMDYHLDWLYASLFLASGKSTTEVHSNHDNLISATQEYLDLIVAYESRGTCHIVMLEAKGVTGFTNRQMRSKVDRLVAIFGKTGNRWEGVVPHFGIVSPREPKRIETCGWPAWVKPGDKIRWIEMPVPPGLRRITRCTEDGKPSIDGRYWRVVPS